MSSRTIIAPSILAADFTRLADEIQMVNESNADWLHVDVMDGRFVPNITFGMPLVAAMKKLCTKPLDVHLMIEEPERYIEQFSAAGADIITVHYEACRHLHRTVQQIRATGAKVGVALNPHTSVLLLEDVLEEIDMVCIMSVNPGFGGQKFIYQTIPKIRLLSDMIAARNLDVLIEIDGGVGLQNAATLLESGANVLVAGNSVFGAKDPKQVVADLKQLKRNKFLV
jgi:ribulose-phosphate 3-epimerase